jgi:zinc/manganese transport system substrate-binding protein
MLRRPILLIITALSAAALTLTSCAGGDGSTTAVAGDSAKPVIVATTSILGDITSNVVGDLATVKVLIPANTDPHDFEPSARQVAELRDADLIVANGLLLEDGLVAIIESARIDGTPVVAVGELVNPLTFDEEFEAQMDAAAEMTGIASEDGAKDDEGHSEDEEGHSDDDHGEFDPHFWMDPTRVARAAGVISTAVADNTDVDASVLADQTAAYEIALLALDAELEALLADIPAERRVMVTNHDAFGYLAVRYGFDIVGTVIPSGSDMAEPSAAALANLAKLINELSVPAIFTENTTSPNLANTLAAETGRGVDVVPLFSDAIGEPGSGGESYIAMMRTNGQRIAAALG